MGLSRLTGEELAAWVASSCAAQGVPVKVTDPTVVRRVGALLGAPAEGSRAQPRSGSTRPADGRSVAPHDGHAERVQFPGSLRSGGDDGVVDQGCDDGVLPRQGEITPRSA